MEVFIKFSDEEYNFIEKNIGILTVDEIAAVLNRSAGSISSLIFRKNIKQKLYLNDGEIIKPIFDGRYMVSNFGRVFNHLNQEVNSFDSFGYRRITLSPEPKIKKKYFIHRLVAEAFLNKIDGKDFVNHIDLNKMNNHVENLEWVSASENELHKMKNLPNLKNNLSKINSHKDSQEKTNVINSVNQICALIVENRSISDISKITEVSAKRISAIKNKRLWKSISDKYF